jgi:hypothetical protein
VKPTSAKSNATATLPEGPYGRANHQAIATREARLAAGSRAAEHPYSTALHHDKALIAARAHRQTGESGIAVAVGASADVGRGPADRSGR